MSLTLETLNVIKNQSKNKKIKVLMYKFCSRIFRTENNVLQLKDHTKRAYKGSGNRTHNDGFEDRNFTTKLFL